MALDLKFCPSDTKITHRQEWEGWCKTTLALGQNEMWYHVERNAPIESFQNFNDPKPNKLIILVHPDTTQAVAHYSAMSFYNEQAGGLDDLSMPDPAYMKTATLNQKQKILSVTARMQ